jgi:hypothetical protein
MATRQGFARRGSEYFRSRASVVIVKETRGQVYPIISLLLASITAVDGFRCIFRCNKAYPWEPESVAEKLQELWPACDTDPLQGFVAGSFGLLLLSMSLGNFFVATTSTVADFYLAIRFVLLLKIGMGFLMIRSGFLEWSPLLWKGLLLVQVVWDAYLTSQAKRAHGSRARQNAEFRKEA